MDLPLDKIELPGNNSMSLELYALLRNAILKGVLFPGERLIEQSLAARAKISRTPVREALRRLEAEGLVRAGTQGLEVVLPSEDELADLCSVREVLEGMSARLAARYATPSDVALLRNLSDSSRRAIASERVEELVSLNHQFHERIWVACRNRYLAQQLRTLRMLIDRMQDTTLRDPVRRSEAQYEHERILTAIENQDMAAAEIYTKEHFRNAEAARLNLRRQRMIENA